LINRSKRSEKKIEECKCIFIDRKERTERDEGDEGDITFLI